jgi:hypothetical protein
MELKIQDYNNAESLINGNYSTEWGEIVNLIDQMPLHIKASDQAGKQGQAIFDPVGTNSHIKKKMQSTGWIPNKEIPEEYRFLGTDIDFVKSGILVEAQFSNYPFLLNNLLRSELFFQAKTKFTASKTDLLVIITKGHMFPASNSTLYFEQACNQLDALASHNVFDIPVRLVGLMSPISNSVPCAWTTYDDPRYSRTVKLEQKLNVKITAGKQRKSRTIITK